MTRRILAALVLLASILTPLQAAPRTVTIGVTAKNAEETQKNFGALIRHLATSTTYKFNVQGFPTYDALYDAFKANKIDFALLGAVKYVEAHNEIGAMPLVSEGGMVRSVIFVKKGSPYKSAAELKGKRFAFGYADSTSTHLFPLLLLSKNHIKENDLGAAVFAGHDQQKIVDTVVAGGADAGAVIENVFRTNTDKVRALEVTPPFPGSPLVAHKNADAAMLASIKKLLLGFKNPAGPRFVDGVSDVKDSDFNQVRFLCKVLYGKTYL